VGAVEKSAAPQRVDFLRNGNGITEVARKMWNGIASFFGPSLIMAGKAMVDLLRRVNPLYTLEEANEAAKQAEYEQHQARRRGDAY
jgi:hypothetical protein